MGHGKLILGMAVVAANLGGWGYVVTHRTPGIPRQGWARVCDGAPHRQVTPAMHTGLREAGLEVGRHGWEPTVEWINEQCRVVQGMVRVAG